MKYVSVSHGSCWNYKTFMIFYYFIISLYFLLWIIFKFIFYSLVGFPYLYSSWYLKFSTKISKKLSFLNYLYLFTIFVSGFILQILFWIFFIMYLLSYFKYKNNTKNRKTLKHQNKKTFCKYSIEFFNWKIEDEIGKPLNFSYHFFSFFRLCWIKI
jgi:hypothetical protein